MFFISLFLLFKPAHKLDLSSLEQYLSSNGLTKESGSVYSISYKHALVTSASIINMVGYVEPVVYTVVVDCVVTFSNLLSCDVRMSLLLSVKKKKEHL